MSVLPRSSVNGRDGSRLRQMIWGNFQAKKSIVRATVKNPWCPNTECNGRIGGKTVTVAPTLGKRLTGGDSLPTTLLESLTGSLHFPILKLKQ